MSIGKNTAAHITSESRARKRTSDHGRDGTAERAGPEIMRKLAGAGCQEQRGRSTRKLLSTPTRVLHVCIRTTRAQHFVSSSFFFFLFVFFFPDCLLLRSHYWLLFVVSIFVVAMRFCLAGAISRSNSVGSVGTPEDNTRGD